MNLKSDLKSSLVVFLVALPLCLGIALASNAPLSAGIMAGIIGGLVVGFLSDSGISVSGPAAGLTVIVVNGIASLGSFEVFTAAVLMAGVLQILFGLLRGGAIGDYIPTAVIKGMLSAIGLILIMKQAPLAFGYYESRMHFGVLAISVVSLSILVISEKFSKRISWVRTFPGALIAVVVGIFFHLILRMIAPEHQLTYLDLVQLPEDGFKSLFQLHLPDLSLALSPAVLKVSITLAIVASLETLLCIEAADRMDPLKRVTSKNRELFAQGAGNTLSGLLGGLPITAVIVRTTANVAAGARSKASAIIHGVWLLLCVGIIPWLLNQIPLAVLACILLLTGWKLARPTQFFEMYKRGWEQLFIYTVTIGAILLTDLLVGIGIGLLIAMVFELTSPPLACLEKTHEGDRVNVKFTRNVSFLHKARIHKLLSDIPATKTVHLQGTRTVRMHVDVHELIMEYQKEGLKKGVVVIIDT